MAQVDYQPNLNRCLSWIDVRAAAHGCWWLVGLVLFALMVASCIWSPYSGDFLADQRPDQLAYLHLIQDGASVSGYLRVALPDDHGGASATTAQLQGTTEGGNVTLTVTPFLAYSSATLVGRRDGDTLVLSVPAANGGTDTWRFSRAGSDSFATALASWQSDLAGQTQSNRQAAVAATAAAQPRTCAVGLSGRDTQLIFTDPAGHARDWCDQLVNGGLQSYQLVRAEERPQVPVLCTETHGDVTAQVRDSSQTTVAADLCPFLRVWAKVGQLPVSLPSEVGHAIQQAAVALSASLADLNQSATTLQTSLKAAQTAATQEQASLDVMRGRFSTLQEHGALQPMTCYQANETVRYDVEQVLRFDLDQRLGYQRKQLGAALDRLGTALDSAESALAAAHQNADDLLVAETRSPYPLPTLSVGLDEDAAPTRALTDAVTVARAELARLRSADTEAQAAATKLLSDAQTILAEARAQVEC